MRSRTSAIVLGLLALTCLIAATAASSATQDEAERILSNEFAKREGEDPNPAKRSMAGAKVLVVLAYSSHGDGKSSASPASKTPSKKSGSRETLADIHNMPISSTKLRSSPLGLGRLAEKFREAKRATWQFLERKDVKSTKSFLLMLDVLFVIVSIQSQLDSSRERVIEYAIEPSAALKEPPIWVSARKLWFPSLKKTAAAAAAAAAAIGGGEAAAQTSSVAVKRSHIEKAIIFRGNELFTIEASLSILAVLLTEKLARIWAHTGEHWYHKKSEVIDFGVIGASIVFEWIFHKMEHDGSLKSLKGSFLRFVTENWRFIRIIHGSYETLAHSPIITPLLKDT